VGKSADVLTECIGREVLQHSCDSDGGFQCEYDI
jgi:hypothetical protein